MKSRNLGTTALYLSIFKNKANRSFYRGAVEKNPTWNHKVASLGGLRICRCRELWCRSQTQLGSCSSHWTPSLGTSLCHECGPTKQKKKKKKKPTERKPYLEVHQLKKKNFFFLFCWFFGKPEWLVFLFCLCSGRRGGMGLVLFNIEKAGSKIKCSDWNKEKLKACVDLFCPIVCR